MIPNSPWLCLYSSRVKVTAAAGAPAFDIWEIRQSILPPCESQAACAAVINCGVTGQTADASTFAGSPFDCASRQPARQTTERSSFRGFGLGMFFILILSRYSNTLPDGESSLIFSGAWVFLG